jgi:hypothetical protein
MLEVDASASERARRPEDIRHPPAPGTESRPPAGQVLHPRERFPVAVEVEAVDVQHDSERALALNQQRCHIGEPRECSWR